MQLKHLIADRFYARQDQKTTRFKKCFNIVVSTGTTQKGDHRCVDKFHL